MPRNKVVIVCAFLVVALIVASVVLLRDKSSSLPNPNGYDDFVKAGQMVNRPLDHQGHLADYRDLSLEELQTHAASNAAALQLVRTALEQPSLVPIQNHSEWFGKHLKELSTFKDITQVFMLAGRLAQLEGKTNEAVNLYLDSIRFAHKSNRGGVVVHTALVRNQESMGLTGLKTVAAALDAVQCRQIATVLEELDKQQEPWGRYSSRDLNYTLRAEIKYLFSLENWRSNQRFKARFLQAQLLRRHNILAFAARAYELETGSPPTNATALVPIYLKKVPIDPTSGRPLSLTTNQFPR